jgi:hypothetical protein
MRSQTGSQPMTVNNIEDLATFLPIEGDTWPARTIVIPVIGILLVIAIGRYGNKLVALIDTLSKRVLPGTIKD